MFISDLQGNVWVFRQVAFPDLFETIVSGLQNQDCNWTLCNQASRASNFVGQKEKLSKGVARALPILQTVCHGPWLDKWWFKTRARLRPCLSQFSSKSGVAKAFPILQQVRIWGSKIKELLIWRSFRTAWLTWIMLWSATVERKDYEGAQ